MRSVEQNAFLAMIVAISLAFAWILWPFYGAVLWGTIIAVLFAPLYRRLVRLLGGRRNLAAFVTVFIIVTILILPVTLVESGEIDFGRFFRQVRAVLPGWATDLLDHFGVASLEALQEKLSAGLVTGSQYIATQALDIGQSTFDFVVNLFVMLYLLFFLLRDEAALSRRIRDAIPLLAEHKQDFLSKFTIVIRATVKGDLLVALLQGTLGGLIFWFLGISAPLLWGVVMAFFSLLPAIGAGLIWAPVAIYLLASGAVWQGAVLVAFGALVIGLVDNFLRPILVGKDTKLPDYVVLISTLGGIATFGLNGFVVGPVIAAMFMAAWDIFTTSRKNIDGDGTGRSEEV
ncbi:AI-2E family transporter [Ancylobacter dichloromethanicus]|uniref:AI-2E family transporter n=1 Tax=Ancylobacter dichloromethanicus TaxID=518825 RepID=A0A9W6N1R9_9HYPH|nr:AI-2E family transporter [Ancylobacter dichloromethanicus]MBS7552886.1 AI-2E family transporter [Ancylobacter dichloromethanicus]GLK74486.1 AI-2E family transporter [Ancylobacter dichloromethanicus]